MGSLEPLDNELGGEERALASALRELFAALEVSVRRYGARRHRDAGTISRYLNGTRIPPWEFVLDLLNDVGEQHGYTPTLEVIEHIRTLHRQALSASGSTAHRVQLLQEQLADADRQARRSAVRERAIEDALLDAQRRAADLELQIKQLQAAAPPDLSTTDLPAQAYEGSYEDVRTERDKLRERVTVLTEELQEAHARRIRAEQRCEDLERQLVTAEEQAQSEKERQTREGAAPNAVQENASDDELLSNATVGSALSVDSDGQGTDLNPRYTFETFVVGASNRFAQAAAVAVGEGPARSYNPLFIYGESGLGKTHLLHAIGHHARSIHLGTRVRYVSSEGFTNEFINSIRDGRLDAFREGYRNVDILLFDEVQFLAGTESAQEEFFHTFNSLHNANKQIVLSSDRPPKQLATLEDRLRNRFESGLITNIQPPDLETRIAILRKKAAQDGMDAPPEVMQFLASGITRNIRELEGVLIRVTAFAILNRQPVDLRLAESVLRDFVGEDSIPEVTADRITAETAAYFGFTVEDLRGFSRSRVLVTARQIAMYLCRELTDLSMPKIGAFFGGRDHTVVVHADRKIRALMAEQRSVHNQIAELTARISANPH